MTEASELLNKVFEASGGKRRWLSAATVEACVSAGGLAFLAHGRPSPLCRAHVTVQLDRQCTIINPFPRRGLVGTFDDCRVEIADSAGNRRRARSNPRDLLFGLRRKVYWDDLDVLYFCGYALWNYLSFPRLLLATEPRLGGQWTEDGETWQRMEVSFPRQLHTHCCDQVFYIDENGMQRRHDYRAEVIGTWAKAAHYCSRYRNFGAGVFATRRAVFPRRKSGKRIRFPRLVEITVHGARLRGLRP